VQLATEDMVGVELGHDVNGVQTRALPRLAAAATEEFA
jgi:hypothetical protein